MTRWNRIAVAASAAAVLGAGAALAVPAMAPAASIAVVIPGQTATVTVNANNAADTDSTLALAPGQQARITATGSASCGNPSACGTSTGPNGVNKTGAQITAMFGFGPFKAPSLRAFSLIGRIDSGPYLQLGTGPTLIGGSASGEIFLAYNDNYYPDNTGSYKVTVQTCTVSVNALGIRICVFL